jgi:hypothetical protein
LRLKNELAQLNSGLLTWLDFYPIEFGIAYIPWEIIQTEDKLNRADPLWGIQPGRLIFVL